MCACVCLCLCVCARRRRIPTPVVGNAARRVNARCLHIIKGILQLLPGLIGAQPAARGPPWGPRRGRSRNVKQDARAVQGDRLIPASDGTPEVKSRCHETSLILVFCARASVSGLKKQTCGNVIYALLFCRCTCSGYFTLPQPIR